MSSSPVRSISPYKNVKSKVAGNMASQKKAKKTSTVVYNRQLSDKEILTRLNSGSPVRTSASTVKTSGKGELHYIAGNSLMDLSSNYIVGLPQDPVSPTRTQDSTLES